MIYLHSLLHYSSHLPHNICFFFSIYTYFKHPTVNVQPIGSYLNRQSQGFPLSPRLCYFNSATWLIGRRDQANSIIMIYETISSGHRAFSPDLTTTCNKPCSNQYLYIFHVQVVNFSNISLVLHTALMQI